MKFHEHTATDLNTLFGMDLGWEYDERFGAELPRDTPLEIAQICVQYDRLAEHGNELIQEFKEDDKFDRKKTGELTIAVRELLGITPTVAGMVRTWADSQGLTAYEIGGKKEGPKKQRWQRWLSGDGLKTAQMMQEDLMELGFTLTIAAKN
jgi:hypothetical protein